MKKKKKQIKANIWGKKDKEIIAKKRRKRNKKQEERRIKNEGRWRWIDEMLNLLDDRVKKTLIWMKNERESFKKPKTSAS